jgi:hypothetical protein
VCEGVYGEGATRQLEEISVSRNSILPAVPNRRDTKTDSGSRTRTRKGHHSDPLVEL